MEIKELIIDWQNEILKTGGIERKKYFDEIYHNIGSKPMKIITGFRRVGKSFLAKQIAKKLIEKGEILMENILYLNFEDFELMEHKSIAGIKKILQVFESSIAKKGKKILILDEIQNIADRSVFLRTLYEKNSYEIIITGSNSQLLSSELGSHLAGRFIDFHILPFEFEEILQYYGLRIKNENDFIRNKTKILKHRNEYMTRGGLPEILEIATESAKKSYLQGVIDKVILDDIVARFRLRNVKEFEKILFFAFSCIGQNISIINIVNKFKSLADQNISSNQVSQYIEYMVKVFALYPLSKFDRKLNKLFEDVRKYYALDIGLMTLLHQNTIEKEERKLENIVYLHIKKYFGSRCEFGIGNNREIDFIIPMGNKEYKKIQVCHTLNQKNAKRELGNLEMADIRGKNILCAFDNQMSVPIKNIKIIDIVKRLVGIEKI